MKSIVVRIILIFLAIIAIGIGQFLEIPWVETLTIILGGIWLGVVFIGLTISYINKKEYHLAILVIGIAVILILFFLIF